jgi:hypothetical protein
MSRLTHGKEENIVKDKISKTPFPNWDRRLEISDNGQRVITKVSSRDGIGGGNNVTPDFKGQSRVHLIHAPRRQHI